MTQDSISYTFVKHITFDYKSPVTLDMAIHSYVNPFRIFLSISMDNNCTIENIGFNSQESEGLIECFFQYKQPNISQIHFHQMFFTYSDISSYIPECLPNWFNFFDTNPYPIYYFDVVVNNVSNLLESNFILITQALEGFHRQYINNNIIPVIEYKKRRIKILNSIPCKYRKWLDSVLTSSNEPSLGKRLQHLIINNPAIPSSYLTKRQLKSLINKVVETRNFYTHLDKSKANTKANTYLLSSLTQFLVWVMKTQLLLQIGIPSETITVLLNKSRNYEWCIDKLTKAYFPATKN